MRLAWAIALFVLIGAVSAAVPALAQTEEEALIEAVRQAEADVKQAEERLNRLTAEFKPKIDAHEQAVANLDRLRSATGEAYDAIDDAYGKVERLPVTLSARENALMDVLIRMYNNNASRSELRKRERELEDVRRQIAQFRQDNVPAKLKLAAARARADRLYAQLQQARRTEADLAPEARAGVNLIEEAKDALAKARDALQKARSNARWRLNEKAPPYLEKVTVKRGGRTFYEAEWEGSEEDAEELLRLAQYLHEDLSRTIPLRRERVDEWVALVQEDQAKAAAAMNKYVELMGGSYNGGFMGGVEKLLDKVSFGTLGAVVTGGVHPWRKTGIEIADSALTIFRDQLDKKIPWQVALFVEAFSQVADATQRAWRGQAKNPGWDVTTMTYAQGPVSAEQSRRNIQTEQQMYNSIDKARVRSSLEKLRKEVEAGLKGEDFREKLLRTHSGKTLAVAFARSTVARTPPVLDFSERNPISGSDSTMTWVWNLFSQPSGMMKTAMKTHFYQGYKGGSGIASKFDLGKDMVIDALQAAARDGIIEYYERERLEIWYEWVYADAELQMSVAGLKNEGRLRRFDEKIQKVLAEELIPELTREVESLRATHDLKIIKDSGVTGSNAKLTLSFTDEVVVEAVKLGEIELEPTGRRKKWQADIDLEDFEEALTAQLIVTARHAAIEDRALDDPKTTASWSTERSAFNSYEPKPDEYHKIRLTPPDGIGYAIVLDTSGSMEDNGRIGQAKTALAQLFESGRIKEGDTAGLFTFSGCSPSQSVAFSKEIDTVSTAIANAGVGGGTPLAATVMAAADSLTEQNVERGVLVVVTDGEDSCDGDVGQAFSYARDKIDAIRRRIVR